MGGAIFSVYRNAPVVDGLAVSSAHLQNCQTTLTTPASTVLAEASSGVKIVTLMALADLCGLPSLLFTRLCYAEVQYLKNRIRRPSARHFVCAKGP